MKNAPVIALLWIATAGVAWFVGSQTAGGGDNPVAVDDDEVAALREENEELRRELQARGPGLEASPKRAGGMNPAADEGDSDTMAAAGRKKGMPEPFSIEGVQDPALAIRMFQDYAREMWAQGKEGHLGLIKTLNDLIKDEKQLEKMFSNEQEAIQHLYPMIKFLINNEHNVADTTEVLFETMATDPQAFGDYDDNALEVFTEGAAMFMPAIMSKERMEKMRGYARKILETPKENQSEAIRKNRSEIGRLMRMWQPPLTPEEALAKLQAGEVSTEEIRGLLGKLKPEHMNQIDLPALLGPMIAEGDYRAMSALGMAPLDARTTDALDRHFLDGAKKGTVQQWSVQYYLRSTKRLKWADARALVEAGFEQGGKSATMMAGALLQLPNRPDKDWVAWALGRYDLPDNQVQTLKRAFGIQ